MKEEILIKLGAVECRKRLGGFRPYIDPNPNAVAGKRKIRTNLKKMRSRRLFSDRPEKVNNSIPSPPQPKKKGNIKKKLKTEKSRKKTSLTRKTITDSTNKSKTRNLATEIGVSRGARGYVGRNVICVVSFRKENLWVFLIM